MYSTVEDSVKMVVANKLDKVIPFEYWLVTTGLSQLAYGMT